MEVPASAEELQPSADITFLALTAWREARGESNDAIAAVCHAIMNRVVHPKWWGHDVMTVVFKRWQFSSLTDPHDMQLTTWPLTTQEPWQRCLMIAYGVYTGDIANPAPGADSYFDDSIAPPKWADPEKFVAKIGRLNFYNLDDDYEHRSSH